jgi:predicted MFS family arabinose efflux permease
MVNRSVLINAIALNSTMFNMAMVVGPAVGGLAYALFGPGWCFTINGLSFVAVIIALGAMKLARWAPPESKGNALADIKAGLAAVTKDRRVLAIICLLGATNLFGMAFATLMPAWAVQILHGDASTNGFLQSARGIGALGAALAIATLAHRGFRGRAMTIASFLFPLLIGLFAITRSLPLSLAVLVVVGAANIIQNNLANSLVQTLIPDHVRGRVMGIYMLSFSGFAPIGALLAGAVAVAVGAPLTVALGALGLFVCATIIAIAVPSIRRLN